MDHQSQYYKRGKYFCSTKCEGEWLCEHMESIEQSRPIEFIRHRRESGGYHKVTNDNRWGASHSIERVDTARD